MSPDRLVLLSFALGAVLTGAVLQSGASAAFLQLGAEDTRFIGGLLNTSTAIALLGTVGTFFGLARNARATKFVHEVVAELLRVTWPSREETLEATTTVIFTSLFVSLVIGFYDLFWKNVADFFLFTEG